jgi:hypothetical protein
MARLAASDDMLRRFGLPPGQAGAHHRSVRELFVLIPLADMGQLFLVMPPLSGAVHAGSITGAVPGQGAVRRAKKGADAVLKSLGLAPRLRLELGALPQRGPAASAERPRAALTHQNKKLGEIKLGDLAATAALGFDQEHKKTGESGRRYGAYK